MADNSEKAGSKLRVSDIARPRSVIHPALDWVGGQLIVGVKFQNGDRAVLTSKDGLVEIEKIGLICERDGKFESPVTPEVAEQLIAYLGSNPTTCPKEDLNAMLSELADYFSRFVVFPEKYWSRVMATWTLATYLFPVFQAFPYLWLNSPEPGCGKSLLGEMLANVSFNGEFMASPTEATLFRLPEQNRGVQVWDEFELSSHVERNRFQSLKAILLNGYRNGGMVPRQVGNSWETSVRYHVFCPRVLIGLSDLPEPVRQRTIELRLHKRKTAQRVELYRNYMQRQEEGAIRRGCVLAALKCASKVAAIYNSEELRAQLEKHIGQVGREVDDIWMPLFAVAAAASQSMDFEENPCFRQLLEAAKRQAAARHAKTADWKSPTPWTANEESEAEMDKIKLVAALRILEWRGGLHPAKLAKDVSMPLNMKVSAQWLSKRLARLGIRAKKERGKRVFSCSPGEVRQALGRLGVEVPAAQASDAGQQGQEGHQQENNDASNAEQPIVENR